MANRPKAIKSWMTIKLRNLSLQWRPRGWAKSAARVSRGKYKCASCEKEHFGPKDIIMDHIDPCVPLEDYSDLIKQLLKNKRLRSLTKTENDDKRFTDLFNLFVFMSRLFVQQEHYQVLCKSCSHIKTELENEIMERTAFKKNK